MPFDDLYDKHGRRVGIDPQILKRFAQVENNESPYGCTGSYCGIMQLSRSEFRRWGGTGSIFDPEQNIMAAANKLANEKAQFKAKYDRDPEAHELYLIHNQGWGGAQAHLDQPDRLAQHSMHSTGEGGTKGFDWSGRAVALNTPGGTAQYGGLRNMTSRDFTEAWRRKFEGTGYGMQSLAVQDQEMGGGVSTADPAQHGTTTADADRDPGEPISRSKPQRAGRGAADVEEKSLLNKDDEPEIEFQPPKVAFQVPDLSIRFPKL